jgi:membrane protein YqaA with SNARE-associated domain
MKKVLFRSTGLLILLAAIFAVAFFAASHILGNEEAQEFVSSFGYFGVFTLSVLSGLNLVVPIPAPAFVPIFTAAGYPLWSIVVTMVVGITIADLVGYLIGLLGKEVMSEKYPRLIQFLHSLQEKHSNFIIPFIFIYSAFSPLPNEAIMIPLAMMGYKLRTIIIPFVLGTIIYVSLFAYGVQNIFERIF